MDLKKYSLNASNRASLWMILLILVIGSFFSSLIPPFQSPDEFAHIERAYLLSKGTIILDAPGGKYSGGLIDSGLLAYMNTYDFLPSKLDRRLSSEEINSAKTIKWTGIKEFHENPGTGFYFPLIYTPQAIGLTIGDVLGLTVDTSYYLARFFALASISLILFAAFNIYPVNPLTIALLIIPMSVFQLSSASLDGISTAWAILSLSTFLRIAKEKVNASPWLFYILTLSVILVATSRANLLPLLILIFAAAFYIKNQKLLYVSAFAVLFVLVWTATASKTTVGFIDRSGAPTSSIILFYLKNPLAFFEVLIATLSSNEHIKFYRESFFGVLGWLDTRFSSKTYKLLFLYTMLIGLFSVSVKNLKIDWVPRLVILLSALTSILLIFFALLVTWNRHPASVIDGVQGRYFLVPMIMIAYAISGESKLYEGVYRKIAVLLIIFLGAFTIFATPKLLVERYYLALEQPEQVSVVLRASKPLDQNNPIRLFMNKRNEASGHPLKRIGVMLGTYSQRNSGRAELRLTNPDDQTLTIPFDLPDLADNQYKYFELDSMPYSSGQIFYLTGGGISTWEAYEEKESAATTCLIFEYTNGKKLYTPGCPRS
ncbi:MAG: DUF2142 domain-containing protein [Methylobacter sp.]